MVINANPKDSSGPLRLLVIAAADPGALLRVLEGFQNMNIVPRRVAAEAAGADLLYIEVEVVEMTDEAVNHICAKLNRAVSVLSICWQRA